MVVMEPFEDMQQDGQQCNAIWIAMHLQSDEWTAVEYPRRVGRSWYTDRDARQVKNLPVSQIQKWNIEHLSFLTAVCANSPLLRKCGGDDPGHSSCSHHAIHSITNKWRLTVIRFRPSLSTFLACCKAPSCPPVLVIWSTWAMIDSLARFFAMSKLSLVLETGFCYVDKAR